MAYDFSNFKNRVKEIEERLVRELATVRTGRATPALLDSVQVEAYGSRQPLKHLGSISIEDPRTLRVTLWDKAGVKEAETAIAAANLGVSAIADGLTIRVIFPELTSEKRALLLKLAHEKVEEAKIALRQAREKTWTEIQAKEREGGMGEDEKFRAKDELQKLVDTAGENFEAQKERKEQEIKQ